MAIRAGGDFFFDPLLSGDENNLLLLAGGVGINPLYSILQEFNHHHYSKEMKHETSDKPRATFIYSAQNKEELIFMVRLLGDYIVGTQF